MFELRPITIRPHKGECPSLNINAMCHECGLAVGLRVAPYELRPAWAVYHIESGNALPECFETQSVAMKFVELVSSRMLWWLPWRAITNEPGLGYVLANESAKARHGYEAWLAREVTR